MFDDIIFTQTELSLAQIATSRTVRPCETNFEINPISTYTVKRHGRIRLVGQYWFLYVLNIRTYLKKEISPPYIQ